VPLAHKDMYYETGRVVTCGSRIRRDFVATTTSTALHRLKQAGAIRLGTLQMAEFAYGPTGHNAITVRCVIPGTSIASPRFVLGIRRRGRGSADLCCPGLRHRRIDPDAGAFLRCHRPEDDGRPDQPCGAMPLSQSLDTIGPLRERRRIVPCCWA